MTESPQQPGASPDDHRTDGHTWYGTVRRVLPVVGTIALVLLVVPFLVFGFPGLVGAQDSFVILSGSMEPAMSPGDAIIIGAPTAVAVGDVITFDTGDDVPTTHRVVGVQDGRYITKGDANEEPDAQLVAPADVRGEVRFTIPLIGYVVLWANTRTGYLALAVVPVVLFVANELVTWARRPTSRSAAADSEGDGEELDSVEGTPVETTGEEPTAAVAVADLKLTVLSAAALFGYAAWMLHREITTFGAPDPVSAGALTAGLLGLLFAGWVTGNAWYRRRSGGLSTKPDRQNGQGLSEPAETDGGKDTGGER